MVSKRKRFACLRLVSKLDIAAAIAAAQNALEYPLRRFIKWTLGIPQLKNEPKEALFDHMAPEEKNRAEATTQRLCTQYRLERLWENSSRETCRLNLFYLEMLERVLSEAAPTLPQFIHVADIGPSDWFYVQGLYAGMSFWDAPSGRHVQLTGYEADPFRVYQSRFSGFDFAQAYMRGLTGVEYLARPFETQPDRFDVITMFFPFVFLRDHLVWGLPLRRFDPAALLSQAWISLKAGGVLLVVNQGEAEHLTQKDMFIEQGIEPQAALRHDSLMYHYHIPRYVLLAVRHHQ